MKYLFEQGELTCVALEAELGLKRGDIKSLTVYPGGAVEVETLNVLTTSQQDGMKQSLAKRNLPRGKKSER